MLDDLRSALHRLDRQPRNSTITKLHDAKLQDATARRQPQTESNDESRNDDR
jgi:hypothetical protein